VIAYTATAWTQVIVALSIFVPVVAALALTVGVLRGNKNDPDEQRLKRVQAEYEAQRDRPGDRRP
jgi:hypothetical protein